MMRSNSTYVITPDSFQISQGIIGLPLARPSRRLVAMLLDLLFVALLVKMAGPVLLGLAAAWFAFRISAKVTATGARPLGRTVSLGMRVFGALILFLVATSVWKKGAEGVRRMVSTSGVQVSVSSKGGTDSVNVSPWQALGLVGEVRALENARTEEDARRLAGELATGFRRAGMSEDAVHQTLESIADDSEHDWMERAVESALAAPAAAAAAEATQPVSADSLARAYAAYTAAGDTAAARAIQPQLASVLARDSLDALRGELRQSERHTQQLAGEVERLENRGILHAITEFLDELGIGFGWTGLYFTAFLTLWRGQTPGKRLVGVRVVRLNGQPMTLWMSFERFGGYAAGLVTGLLGFAQVYWDRNRQMIHDKIVETVVVRERGARQAAPAPAPAQPAVAAFAPYPTVRRTS